MKNGALTLSIGISTSKSNSVCFKGEQLVLQKYLLRIPQLELLQFKNSIGYATNTTEKASTVISEHLLYVNS